MGFEQIKCWVARCDRCLSLYEHSGCIIEHFETKKDAIEKIGDEFDCSAFGWIYRNKKLTCEDCQAGELKQ